MEYLNIWHNLPVLNIFVFLILLVSYFSSIKFKHKRNEYAIRLRNNCVIINIKYATFAYFKNVRYAIIVV